MSGKYTEVDAVLVATRWSASVKKVSGRMSSDEFKRRLGFSSAVIVLAYNNFLQLLKSFINKTLKYKADLNLKNNLYVLLCIP